MEVYLLSHYVNVLFLVRQEGRNPYSVTAGGTTPIGAWGYIEAWREMMRQVGIVITNKLCTDQ